MVHRDDLVAELDTLLDPDTMEDYGPNGLQVEGQDEIERIVTGVTASLNIIEAAIAKKAHAVLVHHGILWGRDAARPIAGWHGDRVRALVRNDISLIAYHLPLDLHPTLGNNARLLAGLGLQEDGRFGERDIGFRAVLEEPMPAGDIVERLAVLLGTAPVHIAGGTDEVQTVGVVTGAGQRFLEDALDAGCNLFITGEASEFITHVAREAGIHYVWAGHHATEKGGVQALGEHVADKHGVAVTFVDDPNPV